MNLKFYLRGLGIGIVVTAVIMLVMSYRNQNNLSDEEIKQRAAELGMVEESETLNALLRDEGSQDAKADEVKTEKTADSDEIVKAEGNESAETVENTDSVDTSKDGANSVGSDASGENKDLEETKPASQDKDTQTTEKSNDTDKLTTSSLDAVSNETSKEETDGLSDEKLDEIEKIVDDANKYLESKENKEGKDSQNSKDSQGSKDTSNTQSDKANQENKATQVSADNVFTLSVGKGENSYDIAKKLQKMGAIEDAAEFDTYLCQKKIDTKIYPGQYEIPAGSSKEEVAKIITGGK